METARSGKDVATMVDSVGVRVRAYSLDGVDLGDVHAPPPLLIGDVIALSAGPPLKVVAMLEADNRPVGVTVRPVYVEDRSVHSD